ncbi:type 11 methyltransferase [Oleiphilus messinensis]|uniref:tRNA 5-carboxymethoxyuridine methyltransferase n=1 Tax=Oleiphilus messinensis TaxID=141451 RepID=A0A1Y0I939_9GAMM|nr:methyltransferase domain-containing protein [Oleiphilus messinensis]ARU57032.1 type 11 methyltransferase [Oleiphilus messinensis]
MKHKDDKNFDDLAEKFARKIYSDRKGELRLNVLWQDLLDAVPALESESSLSILDAGGGIGQVSARLAALGHRITLSDISANMLDLAREHFKTRMELISGEQAPGAVEFVHGSVQDLSADMIQQADVVLFHAVLEWLAKPKDTLQELLEKIRPGATISLMFYNQHSVVFRNVIKGNFRKVKTGDFSGYKNSLTPLNPLIPDQVYQWVREMGFEIESKTGIRVVNDYLSRELQQARSTEDIQEMEWLLCRTEPFLSLARYIHITAVKKV